MKIPQILDRIKKLNKPFIMIMPSSKINTQYFRKLFGSDDDPIQIIIPQKRIQFLKMIDVQLILRDCLIKPSDWSVEISGPTAVAEVKDKDYAQDHP